MGQTDLSHSSVGVVEEDLKVLVEVSGVLCHLLLEQLKQTVEGYLTEQVVSFLWETKTRNAFNTAILHYTAYRIFPT